MESVGMMMMVEREDQWSSFNGVSANHEEADFLAQMLFPTNSNNSLTNSNEHLDESSLYLPYWAPQQESSLTSSFYSRDDHSNLHSNSNSNSDSHYMSDNSQQFSAINDNLSLPTIDFPLSLDPKSFLEVFPCNPIMESEDTRDEFSNTHLQLKCDNGMSEIDQPEDKIRSDDSSEPKKRSRISEKGKRNVRSRKNQRVVGSENEETTNGSSSEEDSNESQEMNTTAKRNSNGKTRASRGSATDPQSLYARKRRERINERLKTLQNLVPNGTKVDISTMLEEAVNYVKFLQVQIKLLSSDEMWMYAPLAYNGIFPDNMALDLLRKNN